MPNHNTRKIQREIEGVQFLLLFLHASDSGVKEYAADWLENVNTVYRNSKGQFTSKKASDTPIASAPDSSTSTSESSSSQESTQEFTKEDFEESFKAANFLMAGIETIAEAAPDSEVLDKNKQAQKRWEKEATEEQKDKARELMKDSIGSTEEVADIGEEFEKVGLISEEGRELFLEGADEFWSEVAWPAIREGNIPKLLGESAEALGEVWETIQRGYIEKPVEADEEEIEEKTEEEIEEEVEEEVEKDQNESMKSIGKGTSAMRSLAGLVTSTQGKEAGANIAGAALTSKGIKEAIAKAVMGFAFSEGGGRLSEGAVERFLPEEQQTEQNKAIAGTIGRIASGFLGQAATGLAINKSSKRILQGRQKEAIKAVDKTDLSEINKNMAKVHLVLVQKVTGLNKDFNPEDLMEILKSGNKILGIKEGSKDSKLIYEAYRRVSAAGVLAEKQKTEPVLGKLAGKLNKLRKNTISRFKKKASSEAKQAQKSSTSTQKSPSGTKQARKGQSPEAKKLKTQELYDYLPKKDVQKIEEKLGALVKQDQALDSERKIQAEIGSFASRFTNDASKEPTKASTRTKIMKSIAKERLKKMKKELREDLAPSSGALPDQVESKRRDIEAMKRLAKRRETPEEIASEAKKTYTQIGSDMNRIVPEWEKQKNEVVDLLMEKSPGLSREKAEKLADRI